MSRINIECYSGTTRISALKLSGARIGAASEEIIITVKNGGTTAASSVLLGAIRGDYLISDPVGEDADVTEERGGELVSEKWMEARLLSADAWAPIGETPADSLELGALAAGVSRAVRLRLNVPADASTSFDVYFSLSFRAVAA